ncbi:MAG: hypothetical protein M3176_05120 [Chloroflexota bacterium]|nr:hypothetical protein [Chloroflexota bacterium]MDQ6906193.1 hypothetical protein [Chloroflexota bacterium]
MWLLEAAVAGLVESVDTTVPVRSLLAGYGFVVSPRADERVMLRSLPWVFPQAGSAPGDAALLPTPSGHVLLYDSDGGFRYVSLPDVTLDDLLHFAKAHGG